MVEFTITTHRVFRKYTKAELAELLGLPGNVPYISIESNAQGGYTLEFQTETSKEGPGWAA